MESARAMLGPFYRLQDAELLKLRLETHDIQSEVHGRLFAGAGLLATNSVYLAVATEDEARARAVWQESLRDNADAGPDWRCANCGEENPNNFASCWKCSQASSGGTASHIQERVAGVDPTTKAAPAVKPVGRFTVHLVWFTVACVTAFAGYKAGARPRAMPESTMEEQLFQGGQCTRVLDRRTGAVLLESCDADHDGTNELERMFSSSGIRTQESIDANENGVYEHFRYFDPQGMLQGEGFDADESNIPERWLQYDIHGNVVSESFDVDGNGRSERVIEFDHDRKTSESLNTGKGEFPTQRTEFLAGGNELRWFDDSRDGTYDRVERRGKDGALLQAFVIDAEGAFEPISNPESR